MAWTLDWRAGISLKMATLTLKILLHGNILDSILDLTSAWVELLGG